MAQDPGFELQKAIYSALTGDAALMALITGVYDSVPEGTAFPYVTLGEDTFADGGHHTKAGMEATATLHTWARGLGRRQTKLIMAEIYRILHDSTLNILGHTMVLTRFEFAETLLDPDGVTYHGVQRFRVITREA